jgi:MraZ protein
LFPEPEWESVKQKLAALPSLNPQVRKLKRMLLGHATPLEMDSNGRILLPAKLREYAKLEKSTVMTGQGNKFELWDEATWNASIDEYVAEDFGEITADLETLSI